MISSVTQITYTELPAKTPGGFRFAVVSDVHLGHRRTPTHHITMNLDRYVTNAAFMRQLDALFIPGDLFDDLQKMATDDAVEIYTWINRMLKLAKLTNTPVRILKGTPSHDWNQPRLLAEFNAMLEDGADVQYIDNLTIVDDASLKLTIGYVPDEWRENCEQITREWKELMATRGLNQVDLLFMHGMFAFQIPKAAAKSVSVFDEQEWCDWAKYGIYIGHDHRFKYDRNIVIPSSFERTAHGEEEAKGFLVVDIVAEVTSVYHIENAHAMKYLTVNGAGMSDIEVIAAVESMLGRFYEHDEVIGRLRIQYDSQYDFSNQLKRWRQDNPRIVIESEKIATVSALELPSSESFTLTNDSINITEENIAGMLLREIGESGDTDALMREIAYIQQQL